MITVSHLHKSYGLTKALSDVSFNVPRNQWLGLLGRNGAGKSTLLKLLCGAMQADSGEILIDAVSPWAHGSTVQEKIGYVPETPPLYEDATVLELLTFAARIHLSLENYKEIQESIQGTLTRFELREVAFKKCRELSKGYRQRTGLALGQLHNPPLLILDEPLAHQDIEQQAQLKEWLKKTHAHSTILHSSHNIHEITECCDRVLFIHNGVLCGDVDLTQSPRDSEALLNKYTQAVTQAAKHQVKLGPEESATLAALAAPAAPAVPAAKETKLSENTPS
jgi:ABC-2 type transport system ATP-binding protein